MTHQDGLDFEDVRMALIRIPEISMRLRSAQRVLDRERRFDVDLMTFMVSDHVTFRRYSHLRNWVGEIIKDGLCDRLIRASGASPARDLPTLISAVVATDPLLNWFWPAISANHGVSL